MVAQSNEEILRYRSNRCRVVWRIRVDVKVMELLVTKLHYMVPPTLWKSESWICKR
jgi:hypothetical protein